MGYKTGKKQSEKLVAVGYKDNVAIIDGRKKIKGRRLGEKKTEEKLERNTVMMENSAKIRRRLVVMTHEGEGGGKGPEGKHMKVLKTSDECCVSPRIERR